MIVYYWNGSLQRLFICDACDREIADPAEVRLLREAGALPEETPCTVHADCFAHFMAHHEGRWHPFLLSSPTAAWFI